jgi:lipopolysaccharide transport system ATP-binding protein
MTDIAIRCEGLSKQYRLGERESYQALRDVITDVAASPFRRLAASWTSSSNGNKIRNPKSAIRNSIWALDDVSFAIERGEVVGLIGRNGAGKSTLLKILSRITKPTRGEAFIHGRVGSLLEVGTGFHPELTGRENIYLNGAILGMRKAEIDRQFDEMVAFAEIEPFIDTPVKRYSSGMYVRLAFAVAVHLDPEVLIVDEVLAVGDAQFQRKCFTKMQDVGKGGRTIIFVSHNMSAIRSICSRALALEHGRIVDDGETDHVVDHYLARIIDGSNNEAAFETENFVVDNVSIRSLTEPVIKTFDPVEIKVRFTPKVDIFEPGVYVSVLTMEFRRLTGLDFRDFCTVPKINAGQTVELGFLVESLPLMPGTFQLEIHLKDLANMQVDILSQTYPFEVAETEVYGGRKLDHWFGNVGLRAQPILDLSLDPVTTESTSPTFSSKQ